ncbi:hypothetical protein ASZ90_013229 [hydrocarbon metagenome]|uniref:Uncharacterized protein n=1 Tax=hydrocarbon metagenome TaxID=938273 RepID=A0A0W8F898_9ZZZZ
MPPDLSRLPGLLRAVMSRSPYFYQKLFIIKLKVGCMETKSGTGKNKLYHAVDDEAKRNLVMFQAK